MIGISKLYLGQAEPSDKLRYASQAERRPIVVWNITRRCNLNCLHCYADASPSSAARPEVSTAEAKRIIKDLAAFRVPVLLFSGGEPLLREDLPELAGFAREAGLRVVVSSNGTLLNSNLARELKQAGVAYVGVSLDGLEQVHNRLRQNCAAFEQALAGLNAARLAGLKTGLRITLTRENLGQIGDIFKLIRKREINRVCFYHLVGVGRGNGLAGLMPSAAETRQAMDAILAETTALFEAGFKKEVLTVDNHADGPYLWMKLERENPERARQAWNLLAISGGNSSGVGIAAINWRGEVLPDQFWQSRVLGNVFERPFSAIWMGSSAGESERGGEALEFLRKLRNKRDYVQGRCRKCRFLSICGGNFRARAEAGCGDPWAADPGCYLTEMEIAGAEPYSGLFERSN